MSAYTSEPMLTNGYFGQFTISNITVYGGASITNVIASVPHSVSVCVPDFVGGIGIGVVLGVAIMMIFKGRLEKWA
jgi:hypothetical protein